LFIGLLFTPTSLSKPKIKDIDNIKSFIQPDPQYDPSSLGGLIVGPFFLAKISVNFSTDIGVIRREGRFLAFQFGPYGIGNIKMRPLSRWDKPYDLYTNTTGEPTSHRFWVGTNWFFGTVKYVDDRILVNGWCFNVVMLIDFYYMVPDLTLNPVDDTYVDMYQPDQNFGEAETLEVNDNNGTETARTYFKFNISSIPDNVKIHYALIRLYFCDSEGGGEPRMGIYQVNNSWNENTITWDSQPEFSPTCEYYNLISQYDPMWTQYWDVTDLVRDWKSGKIPNNGVVLRFCQPCENDITRRIFRSKEWSVELEKPVLTILYY
jgi:hypothetical protein